MRHATAGLLFVLLTLGSVSGQEIRHEDLAQSKTAQASKATPRAAQSVSNWQVWSEVTIPAGQTVNFDSSINFGSSEDVRITIRAQSGSDMKDMLFYPYWSNPDAQFWNISQLIKGSEFTFANAGGFVSQTFGSQFRLAVFNNGSAAITLRELVIHSRAQ